LPVKRDRLWLRAAALVSLTVLAVSTGVVSRADSLVPAVDIAAGLDAYASGAFVQALDAVRRLPPNTNDLDRFGLQLIHEGRLWVDRVPDDRSRRALVAAAYAIESQMIRAERGAWRISDGEPPCPGSCVLEWACALLSARGAPDAAERTWLLASVALAGSVLDWTFLQSPTSPPGPRTQIRGHLVHARARFPDEPRFRLARAVAIASRLQVLPEMEAPREGEVTGPAPRLDMVRVAGPAGAFAIETRSTQAEYARQQLSDLLAEPTVRAEVLIRLAYLDYRGGAYQAALTRAREAGDTAAESDVRYSARYLAAQASQAMGDLTGAETLFASALDVRPHSQSAALALAALKYRRGDAEPAYALIEAAFRERSGDDDPWRLFLYGDFPRLTSHIAELRRHIGGAR
jgi:hypothetical protein